MLYIEMSKKIHIHRITQRYETLTHFIHYHIKIINSFTTNNKNYVNVVSFFKNIIFTNLILLFSFFLFINLFLAMMSVHRWMGSLVAVSLCALLPTCSMQAFH